MLSSCLYSLAMMKDWLKLEIKNLRREQMNIYASNTSVAYQKETVPS
ncbi:hypothetical protein HMPREF0072_0609 [Anaerococcus lactolyticus ATCC 51172]|uniref:Uncharacterized protein n=2 Tax=Anaerococcus lactolyticus TaxID=33032 RepID=C2BE39_9FIRM|nr:hypothetical protein HMPREF0072_0609 [Anaerococcus lactolyticus ATCC 51172]